MNKKFSIAKTIDLDKIDEEIYKYIDETGENNPYIFMCDATVDAIIQELPIPHINSKTRPNYVTAKYLGYTIFSNNEMKFGEVEIR